MRIKIATWNVNSVRLRLPGIARLVAEQAPDVLCLQEVKADDDAFPYAPLRDLGFEHIEVVSQKAYNGVAILSRLPLELRASPRWCDRDDCRHLAATLPGGTVFHNFYIPAGGDVPDPEANDKFAHKLAFMDELADWLPGAEAGGERAVLVGDLNVAPLETDVWSHRQLLGVVSHTPVEVVRYNRMLASRRWVDAVRRFIPPSERLYSWWSYRARDWSASDRGRRLDHIWVTPALAPALLDAEVLRPARGWATPSDHVPVLATIDL